MWLILALGLGDLLYRWLVTRKEGAALSNAPLSAEANRVFTIDDMPDMHNRAKEGDSQLSELIATLTLRFHSGKSVEQTQQLLDSQLELWQYRVELNYNLVRYITWLLPTIGFLGTIIGIGQALTFAGSGEIDADSAEFLPAVTSQLGLAFDTTMLALLMSAVLVFFLQIVQGREERLIEESGRYCLNNLITRLYVPG
jgi:biopolymer transport protein ExbB/TolQ